MSVRVILPFLFRGMIGVDDSIDVKGKNVEECLSNLCSQYPVLREELFEKEGRLKKWIEIYVNGQSTYPQELGFPVRDGDEIRIILLVAGG